jgi:hypothetical protein
MSRFPRWALAAVCTLLGAAAPARAGVALPDPAHCTLDGDLMLGNARGLPIVAGMPDVRATIADGYQVTVRDVANFPIAGVNVTLKFVGTALRPHSTQSGGQIASCVACPGSGGSITAITDINGHATLVPATIGINSVASPNVAIVSSGIILGTIRFRSLDLVAPACGGNSAVDIADLDAFRCRFLDLTCDGSLGKVDPACDYASEGASAGVVDLSDFNLFRTEFLCGAGTVGPPCSQTQCP